MRNSKGTSTTCVAARGIWLCGSALLALQAWSPVSTRPHLLPRLSLPHPASLASATPLLFDFRLEESGEDGRFAFLTLGLGSSGSRSAPPTANHAERTSSASLLVSLPHGRCRRYHYCLGRQQVFVSNTYTVRVMRNTATGTDGTMVRATDADEGSNAAWNIQDRCNRWVHTPPLASFLPMRGTRLAQQHVPPCRFVPNRPTRNTRAREGRVGPNSLQFRPSLRPGPAQLRLGPRARSRRAPRSILGRHTSHTFGVIAQTRVYPLVPAER